MTIEEAARKLKPWGMMEPEAWNFMLKFIDGLIGDNKKLNDTLTELDMRGSY